MNIATMEKCLIVQAQHLNLQHILESLLFSVPLQEILETFITNEYQIEEETPLNQIGTDRYTKGEYSATSTGGRKLSTTCGYFIYIKQCSLVIINPLSRDLS